MVYKQSSQCMYGLGLALRFGDGQREGHEISQKIEGVDGTCGRIVPHLGLQSQPTADLLIE